MSKTIKFALLCVLGISMVACVTKESSVNEDKYIDSAVLTSKIKTKLIEKLGAEGASIKVKAYRDEVQLTGMVDNAITQQRAGEIAASVGEVRHIRNDVLIK